VARDIPVVRPLILVVGLDSSLPTTLVNAIVPARAEPVAVAPDDDAASPALPAADLLWSSAPSLQAENTPRHSVHRLEQPCCIRSSMPCCNPPFASLSWPPARCLTWGGSV